MSGINDLQEVLASIKVSCDEVAYGFATVIEDVAISAQDGLATFKEKEGLAIIDTVGSLKSKDLKYDGPFAKLTVDAHTSLDMVGLTAAISTKLANNGISANVVAAYYHDHIFVQYEHRHEALKLLKELKDE